MKQKMFFLIFLLVLMIFFCLACLHLYYARFFCHFLNSIGLLSVTEPFELLLPQGMVLGKAYKNPVTGKYLPQEKVEKTGNYFCIYVEEFLKFFK